MGRRRAEAARRFTPARAAAILLALALLAGAGALASGAYARLNEARYAARLPPLPAFSREPAALQAHLAEADRAARADPASADAVGALGLAYHANMFYGEADRAYALAGELSNSAWRWAYLRALVQEIGGDAGAVAAALRRVVVLAPDFSPAWWRLGEAEFKQGRHEAAAAAWGRARELPEPVRDRVPADAPPRTAAAPVAAYAALGLARVALARGEVERARELLEGMLAGAPAFGPGHRLLSSAYAALGRPEDAARSARRADREPGYDPYVDPTFAALVYESRSPTFLLQQAAAADAGTNAAWREYLIRRALRFDADNTDALFELATLLRVLRRYGEALEPLRRLERLAPGDLQVVADIGRCLTGLQRYAEAEATIRRALDGLDDANTRYDLGLVLDRTGRLEQAVVEYRRALDRNPTHRGSLNNLGIALASEGRLPEAAAQFERLVAADPANPDAHANLGALRLSRGDAARAASEFRLALELDPGHAVALEGLTKATSGNPAPASAGR